MAKGNLKKGTDKPGQKGKGRIRRPAKIVVPKRTLT